MSSPTLQTTLNQAIELAHVFASEHPRETRADAARALATELAQFTSKAQVPQTNAFTMLEVSTSQIPQRTALWLDDGPGFTVARWSDYGWVLYVESGEPDCTDVHDACIEAGHPELAALLRFAHSQGFAYVKLDSDGDALPESCGLPCFDW